MRAGNAAARADLWSFVQQFGGAYLSTEGALWRTLALLLTQPGELTRRYLAGQRKHYVLPLRLYLTISVMALLLLRAMTALNVDGNALDIKRPGEFTIGAGAASAGMRGGQFFCEGFPQSICKRLRRRMDLDPRHLQREAEEYADRMVANAGTALFALLPFFALWQKLVYLKRRIRPGDGLPGGGGAAVLARANSQVEWPARRSRLR